MSVSSRLDHHERLMTHMADANGADLDLAMQRGELAPDEYMGALLSCTACSNPEACERHLSSSATGIPDFCRNGAMIARLSATSGD